MGREGFFLEGIKRVMRTNDAKAFRKLYMKAVQTPGVTPDLSKLAGLHQKLRFELRNAMRAASTLSSERDDISRKQVINKTSQIYLQRQQLDALKEYLDRMEKRFSF